jgi:hypothetical protein
METMETTKQEERDFAEEYSDYLQEKRQFEEEVIEESWKSWERNHTPKKWAKKNRIKNKIRDKKALYLKKNYCLQKDNEIVSSVKNRVLKAEKVVYKT